MPELQFVALPKLRLLRWLGCVLSTLLLQTQLFAQLPTIEISSLSHMAVERGSNAVLQVTGTRTDELSRLVFSHDGFTSEPQFGETPLLAESPRPLGTFKVGTALVPVGLYDVLAVGRFGISNPRHLLVVDARIERATGEHSSPAAALELTGQGIVQGRFVEKQSFHVRLTLKQGERLRSCVYTKPIDSRGVPTLIAFSPAGEELGRSRGIGDWPAEIDFLANATGDYLLVAHDFLYRGGSDYPFLLEASVTAAALPAELSLDRVLRPEPCVASAIAAQPLAPPFEVQGNFQLAASTVVDFAATAEQSLWLDVASEQLGHLTDPRLVIYEIIDRGLDSEQLRFLAERDDEPNLGGAEIALGYRDPSLSWKAPRDGTYRIEVRDNEGGQRPDDALGFVLRAGSAEPDFQLVAYRPFPSNNPAGARQHGSNLMRGGTELIEVIALRKHGFAERIEVSVEDLPEGVECAPAVIPTGSNQTALVLVASEDAPAWTGGLRIVGRGQIGEQQLHRVADTSAISWPAIPTFNTVVSRPTADLSVCVNPLDTAPLRVDLSSASLLEVAQGAKLSIPVRVARRTGGDGACLLRPKHLPPKTTMGELTIPADKSEAAAELSVAADAPLGEYTFAMQNETKVKWRANPQALERAEQRVARFAAAKNDQTAGPDATALEAALKTATEEVQRLKKETAEQELTVWLPTTPVRIRIVAKSD